MGEWQTAEESPGFDLDLQMLLSVVNNSNWVSEDRLDQVVEWMKILTAGEEISFLTKKIEEEKIEKEGLSVQVQNLNQRLADITNAVSSTLQLIQTPLQSNLLPEIPIDNLSPSASRRRRSHSNR